MTLKRMPSTLAAILCATLATAGVAKAQSGTQIWLLGGVQNLNQNDTAFPDDFLNVPAVLAITYPVSSVLALEADATWVIPVEQSVDRVRHQLRRRGDVRPGSELVLESGLPRSGRVPRG